MRVEDPAPVAVLAEMRKWEQRMDYADACAVLLARRHKGAVVLTTDHRDFSVYRRALRLAERRVSRVRNRVRTVRGWKINRQRLGHFGPLGDGVLNVRTLSAHASSVWAAETSAAVIYMALN